MDYSYTEDEIRFRDEVRTFLAEEWGPPDPVAGRDVHDGDRERAFMAKVANRGWMTMGWPAEYGGTSFSPMERYILSQEMNRVGAPFPLYNANVLGPLLIKFASDEAKNELLPRMRAGKLKFVLGYTGARDRLRSCQSAYPGRTTGRWVHHQRAETLRPATPRGWRCHLPGSTHRPGCAHPQGHLDFPGG